MAKIGMIGVGNMGGALARAFAKTLRGQELLLSDGGTGRESALAAELGCVSGTNDDAALAEFVVLAVKPQVMERVVTGIAPVLAQRTDSFTLVTIAAGLTTAAISRWAGGAYPVIRIMPNLPVSVGQGTVLLSRDENVKEEKAQEFAALLAPAGLVLPMAEALIDAGSAVSGCGPAYACLFMEALADGGVACGMTRADALRCAAQTLLGTAAVVLETGIHPAQLKDNVCSPGGTTIAGVRALEQGGFRAASMDAVEAAYRRTLELKK